MKDSVGMSDPRSVKRELIKQTGPARERTLLATIFDRLLSKRNIHTISWKPKNWDPAHVDDSLRQMLEYAENNAQAAIEWYWEKKRWKAVSSRACRMGTILFTAAAALIPVISSIGWFGAPGASGPTISTLQLNQVGYLCLGLAALALALDRFLSGSTSWMRYVSTATAIQTALEQFRLDWEKLTAPLAGKTPAGQDLAALMNRITEFSVTVRAQVESETKAWVAEFQANLAELQKSSEAAVETARAQVQAARQKAEAEQQAALQKTESERQSARPGGIDLTVQNASETDAGYEVFVDGQSQKTGVAGDSCAILGVIPGMHELSVQARIGGIRAHCSQLVTITAGAATRAQLTLAKQKSAIEPTT